MNFSVLAIAGGQITWFFTSGLVADLMLRSKRSSHGPLLPISAWVFLDSIFVQPTNSTVELVGCLIVTFFLRIASLRAYTSYWGSETKRSHVLLICIVANSILMLINMHSRIQMGHVANEICTLLNLIYVITLLFLKNREGLKGYMVGRRWSTE